MTSKDILLEFLVAQALIKWPYLIYQNCCQSDVTLKTEQKVPFLTLYGDILWHNLDKMSFNSFVLPSHTAVASCGDQNSTFTHPAQFVGPLLHIQCKPD